MPIVLSPEDLVSRPDIMDEAVLHIGRLKCMFSPLGEY